MSRRVEKPWGHEIIWAHTDRYVGKLLFIRGGHKLSLQFHEFKDESIYLHSGRMLFTLGEGDELTVRTLQPGDSFRIRPGVTHRMEAIEDSEVLEVSTPELDDVVRLQDAYGRTDPGEKSSG
ncbi:MAG: cupin domain-containing protein [Acidobacteriota bacterium]